MRGYSRNENAYNGLVVLAVMRNARYKKPVSPIGRSCNNPLSRLTFLPNIHPMINKTAPAKPAENRFPLRGVGQKYFFPPREMLPYLALRHNIPARMNA
jgi:hypothetical protein